MWVSKRYSRLLTCLIESYSSLLRPVSSEEMSAALGEPSSTLRRDFQDLERLGFVKMNNASSGRIPTKKAIRLYINTLYPLSKEEDFLFADIPCDGDFTVFSKHALVSLAQETKAIGFVVLDSVFNIAYRNLQMIKTGANQVMLILTSVNGLSFSKIFSTKINFHEGALTSWAKLLSTEFRGKSLNQAIKSIGNRIAKDKEKYLKIYRELLFLLEHNDLNVIELLYEGESQFYQPKRNNQLELQQIIAALKEKSLLVQFLNGIRQQEKRGPHVAFGEDARIDGLADCLFIFSHFFTEQRRMGDVGIIGHRYMPFAKSISRVNHISDIFSRKLSGW